MKRASLVKAGNALAPDAFAVVLESESKDLSHGKQPPSFLSRLAAKAEHFDAAVRKAAGHLKRLGIHNDQERYDAFQATFFYRVYHRTSLDRKSRNVQKGSRGAKNNHFLNGKR